MQLRRKRLLHEINFTKHAAQAIDAENASREITAAERLEQQKGMYRKGLAGMRFGTKYPVPKGVIDVQLSEDLSENLRGLKVHCFLS